MKIYKKFQSCFNNNQYKKVIYNLTALVIIGVILLITWDTFIPKKTDPEKETFVQESADEKQNHLQNIQETQLKNILSQIKGVGEVEVMITYETSTEVIPAFNVQNSKQSTEEKDAQGGMKSTTQEDLTQNIVTDNKDNKMVTLKEIKPKIRGVIVVAEGAGDIEIKSKIIEAVKTVFQISISKVTVYEKNNF